MMKIITQITKGMTIGLWQNIPGQEAALRTGKTFTVFRPRRKY